MNIAEQVETDAFWSEIQNHPMFRDSLTDEEYREWNRTYNEREARKIEHARMDTEQPMGDYASLLLGNGAR
jgi:hypothetical protein